MASANVSGGLLEPGVQIRPQTTVEDVNRLAKELYNIDILSVVEINSYDDRNYLIKVHASAGRSDLWEHGYVMKIINSLDSTKLSFVEAQNELMIYLGLHGILCPQPVQNLKGTYYSVESFPPKGEDRETAKSKHVVRLLTFQPGVILHQIECNDQLFYQAGRYVGLLDNVLQGFHHVAYDTHKTLWMLESIPMLRKFLFAVKDQSHVDMVTHVIDTFESQVLPKVPSLQKGIIHGDFNEQNILVRENPSKGEWEIHAVIDFGDTQYSCYVFELAIAMCYMMLEAKHGDPLDVGGHVIAGYNNVRPLSSDEFHLLKICVSARLCQSLVMGTYSNSHDPSNVYLLTTQAVGWSLLRRLYDTPQAVVEERWRQTILSYMQ